MVHCIAYSSGQHTVEFGVLCMSKELSQSLENLGGAQTLPGRFSVPSISGIYTRHKRTRWAWEITNREQKRPCFLRCHPGFERSLVIALYIFHCWIFVSFLTSLYNANSLIFFFFYELSASCSSFLTGLTILSVRICVSPSLPSLTTVPDRFFSDIKLWRIYIWAHTENY